MRERLISIIMPVYNGEKLVGTSIDSVVEQTNSNWELIIVDDGSTDNTGKICTQYSESDNRIKYIKISNSGPATARNRGLDVASGVYCIFIDSDDLLENNAIEKLSVLIAEQELDVVFYGYYSDLLMNGSYKTKSVTRGKNQIYKSNESFKLNYATLAQIGFTHPVWNKMYNLHLIKKHNIRFPKGLNISEDFVFNLQVYKKSESIQVTSEVLYHYVSHQWGSITTNFNENKISAIHEVHKLSYEMMNRWNPMVTDLIDNEYIKNISVYVNSMFNKDCLFSYKSKREAVSKIINNTQVRQCLQRFKPHNQRNRIMAILLRLKQSDLILLTGKISRCLK